MALDNTSSHRILLVRPRMGEALAVMPPLGLGFMATVLRKEGFEVRILDCMIDKLSYREVADYIRDWEPRVVGISIVTKELSEVTKMIAAIKLAAPSTTIVIGGPHVSGIPIESLRFFKEADIGIAGEGEFAFRDTCSALCRGSLHDERIPGLIWRDKDEIKFLPPRLIMDLDAIGIPAWDLLQPQRYPHSPTTVFARRFPTAPIQISRGCHYPCRFCASKGTFGITYRHRNPENVIQEMKLLMRQFGIKEFQLIDDNFFQKYEVVQEFCQALISANLNTLWTIPNGARIDTVDASLAHLLYRSGCYRISVGVESGSQRVLNAMRKNIDVNLIRQKVQLLRKAGIEVLGHFIIGYPGETIPDIEKTLRFSRSLHLNYAGFSHFTPLPGSDDGKLFLHTTGAQCQDYENMSFYVPHVSYTSKLNTKQLNQFKKRAYVSFYIRPRILFQFLLNIRSFNHLRFIIKRVSYLLLQSSVFTH